MGYNSACDSSHCFWLIQLMLKPIHPVQFLWKYNDKGSTGNWNDKQF